MDKKQKRQIGLAAFDGVLISLGAVIALVAANLNQGQLFAVIAGIATSTAVGLAFSSFEPGNEGAAITGGIAIFIGIMLPALPFILFSGWFALIVLALLLWGVANLVGSLRGRDRQLTRQLYRAVLLVVVAVWLVEFATGGIN